LSGLQGNIQQQINNISGNPVGSVIAYAGPGGTLNGYLLCNGGLANISQYNALYNAIGTIYGGDGITTFGIPNYNAVFLRGASNQTIGIKSGNVWISRTYTTPGLGTIVPDQITQMKTSNYVNNINQNVQTFVTGPSAAGAPNYTFNYANAVSSLNYTTDFDQFGATNTETAPVYTTVQYFIKY
jgi:microcystin-dependent protein